MVTFVLKEPITIKEKKWFGLVTLGGLLFFFRNGGLKVTAGLILAAYPHSSHCLTPSLCWPHPGQAIASN
ncbi:hypothetical protein [Paenibacillus sp. yr247]|uniref:hypothetical protein n=1 Tax=Paenibacillus sp. yr247 TaxID=1761880 RepID=UPI000B868CD3|nr:hypothetical protein [Paenibacillus sp. yr247]